MTLWAKVYWRSGGAAARGPRLLSKVHAEGLQLMQPNGWRELPGPSPGSEAMSTKVSSGAEGGAAGVNATTLPVPVFAFTTRRGGNFPAQGEGLPRVRQLPQCHTTCLDDKRLMWECLAAAGCTDITPQTWVDVDALLLRDTCSRVSDGSGSRASDANSQVGGGSSNDHSSSSRSVSCPALSRLDMGPWFLKHRHGVKGQAVYAFTSLQALSARLSSISNASRRNVVVQRDVHPPLLLHGRQFALRAHVLVTAAWPRRAAYVHRDVIVVEHAASYDPASATKAVHVSSAGRGHPAPYLLESLADSKLANSLWQQICATSRASVTATAQQLFPADPDHEAVFCHLWGYDVVACQQGRAYLIEANAYPAIASGTMAAVDRPVYTRLLQDLLTLVVLPAADGVAPVAGGFRQVPL